jgi:hypothetical protein
VVGAADDASAPLRFDAQRLRRASLCASHCDCRSALDAETEADDAGVDANNGCGASDITAVEEAAIELSADAGAGVAAALALAFGRPRPAANDDDDAARRAFLSPNAAAADDDDDGDALVLADDDDLSADAGSGEAVSSEPKNRPLMRFDDDGVCARAARARSNAASEMRKRHKKQCHKKQCQHVKK